MCTRRSLARAATPSYSGNPQKIRKCADLSTRLQGAHGYPGLTTTVPISPGNGPCGDIQNFQAGHLLPSVSEPAQKPYLHVPSIPAVGGVLHIVVSGVTT